ncbi:MAG: hypothetical protein ABI627_31530 [Polyangiaceae bacterium]
MTRSDARPSVCAYCRVESDRLEDEHVFPESWYPNTTPTGVAKIKVPSCSECNRNYGRTEERLQRQLAVCIDVANPAAQGVWDRVRRSLRPQDGRNARDARIRAGNRDKLMRSVHAAPVGSAGQLPGFGAIEGRLTPEPSGLLTLAADAVKIAAADVASFTEKLVRGLHYCVHEAPLPTDVEVRTYVVSEDEWPALLERTRAMTAQGVPPGFIFWRGAAQDDPMFAFWYFWIWGQVCLQASTVPLKFASREPHR